MKPYLLRGDGGGGRLVHALHLRRRDPLHQLLQVRRRGQLRRLRRRGGQRRRLLQRQRVQPRGRRRRRGRRGGRRGLGPVQRYEFDLDFLIF